jgi:hypothetical protein
MDARQRKMSMLERWIRGQAYDHVLYPFSEETKAGSDEYIPVAKRRPSVQANLPRAIAIETSRWLWAGRNRPRLTCDDEALLEQSELLIRESGLIRKMSEATFYGSVGSVAVTFGIRVGADGWPHVLFDTWRAKDCTPLFNDVGELTRIRVQYLCAGSSFLAQGVKMAHSLTGPSRLGSPIEPDKLYWFTRDFDEQWVTTFRPIEENDYNPKDPEVQHMLVPDLDRSDPHALGFVPGEWIQNLPGGEHPDGMSTFEPALTTCVTMDITLSMIPRGLWANLCPQLVLEGELMNQTVDQTGRLIVRGPTGTLQLAPLEKGAGGQQHGGGSAYLLETNGQVFSKAVEIIDSFTKLAKEQIQASRKDPDKLTAPQSGVAVSTLEEEHMGLIQELRCSYGEQGFVTLLGKVLQACSLAEHPLLEGVKVPAIRDVPEVFTLQWPRETIAPDQFGLIEPALVDLVERKLLTPEDVAGWVRTHLDLPFVANQELPEDAGLAPPPPKDPNKQPPGAEK